MWIGKRTPPYHHYQKTHPARLWPAVWTALVLLAALAGCRTETPTPEATAGPPGLTPYATRTRTPPSTPVKVTQTPHPSPTLPPPPTATPFTHEIQKGDSMLSIAFRYGLTLDQLRLANPDVDPNFLSIGTRLVIPLAESEDGEPEIVPTPTALPARLETPDCYPAADGSGWCFVLLQNDLPQALENISAQVNLFSKDGQVAAGALAIPPLNRAPAGAALPLLAYFPEFPAGEIDPQAGLITALAVPEQDGRYLEVQVFVEQQVLGDEAARVTGRVEYPAAAPAPASTASAEPLPTGPAATPAASGEAEPAGVIWLAVTAYDADGHVVGVRKWEAEQGLNPGGSLPFDITVYSAAGAVARVEVLAEARPALAQEVTSTVQP